MEQQMIEILTKGTIASPLLSPDSAIGTPDGIIPDEPIPLTIYKQEQEEILTQQNTLNTEDNSKLLGNIDTSAIEMNSKNKQDDSLKDTEIDFEQASDYDEEEENNSMSESEMVVSGSMQFSLAASANSLTASVHSNSQVSSMVAGTVESTSGGGGKEGEEGVSLELQGKGSIDENVSKQSKQAGTQPDSISPNLLSTKVNEIPIVTEKIMETTAPEAVANGETVKLAQTVREESVTKTASTPPVVPQVTSAATDMETTQAKPPTSSTTTSESSEVSSGLSGLPDTVARLVGASGCEVYVVGTAHFSHESQQDVITTIERVQPTVVVVELCNARTAILQLDEATIIEESSTMTFAKMRSVVAAHGRVQGVLYLLLLSVSAHITRQLGMAPGGEFRAALQAVRKLGPRCSLQLGDRPIDVTLGRALAALSPWHKLKLLVHILMSAEPISKEDVEKCKNKDMIEELLAEMTGEFPAISEVFVRERDVYLAHSLYLATLPSPLTGYRPPARVVGVVGIGHLKGIKEHWGKVNEEDIARISTIPPPSFANKAAVLSLRVTLYGVAAFAAYKLLLPTVAKTRLSSSLAAMTSSLTSVTAAALTSSLGTVTSLVGSTVLANKSIGGGGGII